MLYFGKLHFYFFMNFCSFSTFCGFSIICFVLFNSDVVYCQAELGFCGGYGLNTSLDWPTSEMYSDYREKGYLIQKRITLGPLTDFGLYFRWSERNKLVISSGLFSTLYGMNIRKDVDNWQYTENGPQFRTFSLIYYRKQKRVNHGLLAQVAIGEYLNYGNENEIEFFGLAKSSIIFKKFQPSVAGGYYFYLLHKKHSALRLDLYLNYGLTVYKFNKFTYLVVSPDFTHYVPIRNKFFGFKLYYEFSFKDRKKIVWRK